NTVVEVEHSLRLQHGRLVAVKIVQRQPRKRLKIGGGGSVRLRTQQQQQQLSTARHLVDNVAKDYMRLVKFGDSLFRCKQLKRAALGRMPPSSRGRRTRTGPSAHLPTPADRPLPPHPPHLRIPQRRQVVLHQQASSSQHHPVTPISVCRAPHTSRSTSSVEVEQSLQPGQTASLLRARHPLRDICFQHRFLLHRPSPSTGTRHDFTFAPFDSPVIVSLAEHHHTLGSSIHVFTTDSRHLYSSAVITAGPFRHVLAPTSSSSSTRCRGREIPPPPSAISSRAQGTVKMDVASIPTRRVEGLTVSTRSHRPSISNHTPQQRSRRHPHRQHRHPHQPARPATNLRHHTPSSFSAGSTTLTGEPPPAPPAANNPHVIPQGKCPPTTSGPSASVGKVARQGGRFWVGVAVGCTAVGGRASGCPSGFA
ncbi:unnamed protein product, partial [Tilletia caries]